MNTTRIISNHQPTKDTQARLGRLAALILSKADKAQEGLSEKTILRNNKTVVR
jgi:hypothetical protein